MNNMENKKEEIKDKKEDKKEDIKEENEIKEEIKDEVKDINIKETIKSNDIKKPNMSEEEYQIMMKKRNLMKKNSKHKPMTLLFGRRGKPPTQNNQNNYTVSTPNQNINNTNIQINNYTTYLTSVETIIEEKYQKDGQTLLIENPNYSMKQLNYKYKINLLNKIMIIYIRKINELEDIYNFTNNYLSFIIQIFVKLSQPFIFSLSNMFINNILPNLKYFKEISFIFNEFSDKINNILNKPLEDKINKVINNKGNKKINNMTYLDCNLNDSVKKINNIYANTFKNASINIQNLILNNPLYTKLDTIEIKFTDNYNKMVVYINKLIHRQNKFNDKYNKDVFPFLKV